MSRRILMVSFVYPPFSGSSGVQRPLRFSQHLGDHGWEPIVLTAHPRAYTATADDQLKDIPEGMIVKRAFALDTGRHLALRGAYASWMALPDRWVSWWLGAVTSGLRLIRKYRPEFIWTTYPIATTHLIGLSLSRMTGLPWIADFRDVMTMDDFPSEPTLRRVRQWIERRTVTEAAVSVFTTPGCTKLYAERYPEVPAERLVTIENGYDEDVFREVETLEGLAAKAQPNSTRKGPVVLLHSGVLYRSERDPRAFFGALADLKSSGRIRPGELKVILRASGDEDYYGDLLRDLGVEEIVSLESGVPYREALAEMFSADGLLIFQASNCNQQVPAKIYEYLRARRPILALTDPIGDTATVLKRAGIDTIVKLWDRQEIARGLVDFLERLRGDRLPIATDEEIRKHARRSRARELAEVLDRLKATTAR